MIYPTLSFYIIFIPIDVPLRHTYCLGSILVTFKGYYIFVNYVDKNNKENQKQIYKRTK